MSMTAERFKRSMAFLGIKFDAKMARLLGVDRRSVYTYKRQGAPDHIEKTCKLAELLVFSTRHVKAARKELTKHLLSRTSVRYNNPGLVKADKHLIKLFENLPKELKND